MWRPAFESVYWWVMESRNESRKVLETVLIHHYVLHAWHFICSLMETSSCSRSILTVKLSKTLWGCLAWKPFSLLFFDFYLYDLPWVRKSRFKWLLIWEWRGWTDRGDGGAVIETIVHPWGRVLVPPLGIYITISLNSLRSQHSSYQRKTTWGYNKGTRKAHQEDYLRPD